MKEIKAGAHVRAVAALAIEKVVSEHRSLDAVLVEADAEVSEQDRSLVRMLCYGVLRNHWRLRDQLQRLLERPLKARDRVIESLLVVGFFQLSDTRIPDHAAVSMTVEAARILRRPKFVGLINAVLRNFMRRDIARGEPADDEARYNHPSWLIKKLRDEWPDHWQEILTQNNERAPMWIRVNRQQSSVEHYLAEHSVAGETLAGLTSAIRLAKPVPVSALSGFAEGVVSVQDGAAQIAAPWLLQDGGERILDACAAPGGKTGHIAELMEGSASFLAIDSDPVRLESIHDNLRRLGMAASEIDATVRLGDASKPEEWMQTGQTFDRILLDAPCSASGVIRRHPDITLHRREDDIAALAERQQRMLEALWITLAAGGRLLYVTCSVFQAENEAVIAEFLSKNTDALENRVLHNYNIRDLMIERSCGYQILPGTSGLDGFYFACLEKTS